MRALSLFLLLVAFPALSANRITTDQLSVTLLRGGPKDGVMPLGVEFRLMPEWHVYWKNPGDSGTAPKFRFTVEGGEVEGPDWPAPERIPLGDLTNYGYNERVVFPFRVKRASGATDVHVKLDLEWLVCKVDCVPGFGSLETKWLGADEAAQLIDDSRHPLPAPGGPVTLRAVSTDATEVTLALEGFPGDPKAIRKIDLFPEVAELFATTAPKWDLDGDSWKARLRWAANAARDTSRAAFVATVDDGSELRAIALEADLSVAGGSLLARALLLAFLGGMLLNLMPCVFPVLSLKVLSFIQDEKTGQGSVRRSAWLYTAGVVVSFLLLATLLLVLRAGGEQLGWGFQLQSPGFVTAMALLFFLIGLNFLGVFEMGYGLMNWGGNLQSKKFFGSSFGTGVLATLVATPCTAPFMGSAVGASLLLPPAASLAIFGTLGAGMAAPLLALSYFPAVMNRLPRPGAWMETFKEVLAFPVLATVAWLGWVLVLQSGAEGFLALALGLLGASFALWLVRRKGGRAIRALGLALLLVAVVGPVASVRPSPPASLEAKSSWAAFDEAAVGEARAKGSPVFIDFTAAWCLTCQWNKKNVLHTQRVMDLFAQNGVKLFQADWTDGDPAITRALAGYGRNSVPLYVFIRRTGEPIILPEILTTGMIEDLFR